MRLLLPSLLAALLLSGCATRYMIDQPYVITPCFVEDQAQAQDYATASLLLSLLERRWVVNRVDRSQHRIVAEGCRHGQNCVTVDARVLPDGTIQAFRNPQQQFDQIDLLKRWMAGLNRNYKGRCLTPYETILDLLQRRGIDYNNIREAGAMPAAATPAAGVNED